ncbi:MAG: 16S rRNA (cytosine(1402)-N(4))-methyltransferase RsmH, partial [Acidobacteriota bacterium]|nr:16S rRNA (cytosine(1402)-N(4))-methyltransferase RsmH [Acidobacteriota bacterium]
ESGATQLLGLDRDPQALVLAAEALAAWRDQVQLLHADFRDLASVLDDLGFATIDGAVADLGVSSMQLAGAGRGFSFRRDEPLDMRMDQSTGATAADLIRDISEQDLADLIFKYGEERHSRRIARAIVDTRRKTPVCTTGQLAAIVRRAMPTRGWQRIDPATRTFQAIRIWVNQELDGLETALEVICRRLRGGARVVIITFHSLEDRIVKHTLRALARGQEAIVRILTKHPLVADPDERDRNPRARSAKLRAAERIA